MTRDYGGDARPQRETAGAGGGAGEGLAGWVERVLDNLIPVRGRKRRSLVWLVGLATLGAALVAIGSAVPRTPQSTSRDRDRGGAGSGLAADLVNGDRTAYAPVAGQDTSMSALGALGSARAQDGRAAELEGALAAALGRIQGAGKVLVKVTLSDSGVTTLAENTTEETEEGSDLDSNGQPTRTTSRRRTTREVVTVPGGSQGDRPVAVRVKAPEITGVLVVADGAADPGVRERLVLATTTLLGCPPHRVAVVPQGGELR